MSNPTTNQIKNKSSVAGNTVTEALNALLLVQGDGTGDMLKIVYDNNNNGKVDVAEVAEAVPWTGVTSKPATFPPQTHNHTISDVTSLQSTLDGKQATLVSGTNIKTINGTSVLGSGDITISGGGGGSGDVTGPASSVDGNFALFNGTTGKIIKDTGVKASDFATASHTQAISTITGLQTDLDGKQANLVSGTNIKTVNGSSLLGSGDLSISGGGGLTTTHITGATSAYTASVGENVSIETSVACTVTAPPGLTAGQKWGVMVNNDRWDNVVNMNSQKHNNISDSTMTLKDNKVSVEFEFISAGYGMKVKEL